LKNFQNLPQAGPATTDKATYTIEIATEANELPLHHGRTPRPVIIVKSDAFLTALPAMMEVQAKAKIHAILGLRAAADQVER
jgi:hypothetical protein